MQVRKVSDEIDKLDGSSKMQISELKDHGKKDDIKLAYRRMHLSWDIAIQTVTQIPRVLLALMMLRLSFGGAI